MIEQFQDYLTFKNIYLYTNFLVLPFWLMIILIPNSKITKILVNSIILPLIFSTTYIFIIYKMIILDESLMQTFQLYLDLDNLYILFSTEGFLLVFWLHFVSINLFLGSWMSSDGVKYSMPRSLVAISLIFVYFMGPVGLVLHWFLRIFYAKKINLYD
jgi:hypothetical protein